MATKFPWSRMHIAGVQRFLRHENIETTRHSAEMTAATLRWKFDQIRQSDCPRLQASGTIAVMLLPFWQPIFNSWSGNAN